MTTQYLMMHMCLKHSLLQVQNMDKQVMDFGRGTTRGRKPFLGRGRGRFRSYRGQAR